jgi:hypothetical protein
MNGQQGAGGYFVGIGGHVKKGSCVGFTSKTGAFCVDGSIVCAEWFLFQLQLSLVNQSTSKSLEKEDRKYKERKVAK